MKKNNILIIVVIFLIFPLLISIILSTTKSNSYKKENKSYSVENLYIPDTINNRKEYKVKKTDTFAYGCVFGLVSIAGITYIAVRKIKS